MASFNKVILVGNLTRDPELRYTPKGTAIAKVGLAVNRVWTNEAGEKKEEVTFIDVDVFGRTAENVGQYMRKGRPILIEGRLKLDQWDDKTTGAEAQQARRHCRNRAISRQRARCWRGWRTGDSACAAPGSIRTRERTC